MVVLSENEGVASGSARSVAGCNIINAIRGQASLLTSYGGHNMAAGLSLPTENLFEFRRGLSMAVREQLGTSEVEPQITIDAYLNLADINLDFAEDIARLAPFGNGNPPLTLATRGIHVKSRRTLGSRGDHLDLRLEDDSGSEARVIWWFGDVDSVPEGKFDLAYTVRANVYNGKREALIEWLDARAPEGGVLRLAGEKPAYEILDYRQHPNAHALLAEVQATYPEAIVWREGITDVKGFDRLHLHPAETLIVWSAPPDPLVWHSALNIVQPGRLVLFSERPFLDDPKGLLTHLGGLLKYAHRNKGGTVSVSELAAITGHTEQTVHTCFKWINAHTEFELSPESEDVYRLTLKASRTHSADDPSAERLKLMVAETNAYRGYWTKRVFTER